jgi:hypothetical protein
MPKVVFDKLNFMHLAPTPMMLQLADSTFRYPARIAKNILVKIWGYFVLVDFVVLDMKMTKESPLILGRPFLSTVGAQIDVGAGEIRFNINGKEEKFDFRPRQEQCSVICIKYGLNPQGIKEVEIQHQLMDNLVKKNKENKKRLEQKKNSLKQKEKTPKVVLTPPKKDKKVWKQKKKAPKSTSTPPKSNKMVWRPKKVQSSTSTSPGMDVPSSSKKGREKNHVHCTLNNEPLPNINR